MQFIFILTIFATCVFATPSHVWDVIGKLERKYSGMEQKMQELSNEMVDREETEKQLRNEILMLRDQLNGLEANSLVSFTPIVSTGNFVPNANSIVNFDTAITNPGRHFNTSTYLLTCPSDGMYYFSYSLYSNNLLAGSEYDNCAGTLMLDNTMVVEAATVTQDSNIVDYRQVSASAVVFCEQNSQVHVSAPFNETGIWGHPQAPRSMFSGFMI